MVNIEKERSVFQAEKGSHAEIVIRDFIEQADPKDLAPLLKQLAAKITRYRSEHHDGFVPPELFPFVLEIGGAYGTIEIAPIVDGGFLLKKREGDNEQGWKNCYVIPGATYTPMGPSPAIRLSEEFFGSQKALLSGLEFIAPDILKMILDRLRAKPNGLDGLLRYHQIGL